MTREWYTATELAAEELPGLQLTERGIRKRATAEQWRSRRYTGRGGGFEYHVSALPLTAQMVLAQRATRVDPAHVRVPAPEKRRSKAAGPRVAAWSGLGDEQQRICAARAAAVTAYRSFRAANAKLSDRTCRSAFARAWEAGEIFVETEVRALVRGVSPNTVRDWEDRLAAGGLAALAPAWGNRAGSGLIDNDPDIKRFLLGVLADKPHAGGIALMDGLEARFPGRALPSRRSVQRFLTDWKAANEQLLTRVVNPDKWRSKYKAASGSRSAGIVNPNDCWEADSTPADLLLADGGRHKIVGVIDVATRRLRYHVSRESNSTAIASTLRRAIIDWGVPTRLRIDNGSDYTSKHMWRVYDDLGIEVEVCPPFTPEHKPHVERAFRTFSHDLLEFLPGFIGHNVAERKDIEARRSFADRMTGRGETVEIRMSPEELQDFCDRWCDHVYGRRPHEGLKGRTPFQAATAFTGTVRRIDNERALDILLSPAQGDGWCVVTKKGVRAANGHYDAAEFGGLEGTRVKVLFDEADAGGVWVFTEDGAFLCRAVDPELLGVSRAELAERRKAHQTAVLKAGMADLKKMAGEARPGDLATDILRDKAEKAGKVVNMPRATTSHDTPALAAAGAAASRKRLRKPELTEEQVAKREAMVVEFSGRAPEPVETDPKALRLERARRIEAAIAAGETIEPADLTFIAGYRTTPEYRAAQRLAAAS